jgi:TatD DNase family protein
MFIDSHAHIDGKQFEHDRGEMLFRAQQAGVTTLLAIGNGDGPDDLDVALVYAEKHDWIYATSGIHPHEAKLATEGAYSRLAELAGRPKLLAIGEIGLDYWYDHSPRDIQQQVFVRQLEIAAAAKKPIVIHCRPSANNEDAWGDLLRLIDEHWKSTGLRGVMHCFTGTLEQAKKSLDLGFVLSFAGNITYPKAQNIRDAAAMVPNDSFLIETDCPYLAPIPYRGKRNEPAYVIENARAIGELKGMSREKAGIKAAENFQSFFGLAY